MPLYEKYNDVMGAPTWRLNNGTFMPGRNGWNIAFDPVGDRIIAREYDRLGLPAIDPYARKPSFGEVVVVAAPRGLRSASFP